MNREYRNEDGKLHQEDGPAVENSFGRAWLINGTLHRTDGPAIEWNTGETAYYINGEYFTEEEFYLYKFFNNL